MNSYGLFPFVRLLIPLVVGVLLGIKMVDRFNIPNTFLIALIILAFIIVVFNKQFVTYKLRWVIGSIIFLYLFFAGAKLTSIKSFKYNPYHLNHIVTVPDYYVALISDVLDEKKRSYKTIIELEYVRLNGKWFPADAKIMTYFRKDDVSKQLRYGDRIIFNSHVREVEHPKNPHEFNYRAYLRMNTIYHQVFLSDGQFKTIARDRGSLIVRLSLNARDKLLKSLSDEHISDEEFSVAAALLLGYKDELGDELRSAYSNVGAMHILCVSGLHVGVIFLVLNTLLGFLGRKKLSRIVKLMLLIISIWLYAFVTGLSPSVIRASCMITLVIIAGTLNRFVNIYNILAASAFLMILFNPLILTNVGFQLSYLAVLGIISTYSHINNQMSTGLYLPDKMLSICAVSLAAQIGTFPLSMYYFHQFPNLFLITNILVIPLSSLIIYSGILVFVFSSFPLVHNFLVGILSFLVKLLNSSVGFIDGISFSSSHMINLTLPGLLILYILIVSMIIYLNYQKKRVLWAAGFISLVFVFVLFLEKVNLYQQKYIIIYSVKKTTAIDFVKGFRNCFITDKDLSSNKSKIEYHIKNNWCAHNLKKADALLLDVDHYKNTEIGFYKLDNLILFQGNWILLIDEDFIFKPCFGDILFDKIIISGDPDLKFEELKSIINFKGIIIDSSNSYRKNKEWKHECDKHGVACYSVLESGAYVWDLNL